MGRSRAVLHPAEDDPNQRSKRKRTVSNVETMGITPSGTSSTSIKPPIRGKRKK